MWYVCMKVGNRQSPKLTMPCILKTSILYCTLWWGEFTANHIIEFLY